MASADKELLEICDACNDKEHLEKIKELVEVKHADVNAKSETGRTPLIAAFYCNGSSKIMSYLISKGADATAKTTENKTLLEMLGKWKYLLSDGEEKEKILEKAFGNIEETENN